MGSCHNRHREALEQALTALANTVEELGLKATITGPLTLSVSGDTPAPEATGDPSTAALMDLVRPLSQSVTIKSHGGQLWWCWVWNGPDRGDYESEPIVPIEETDEVARRIRYVVSLSAAT
jgi:hypothetical protein